MSSKLLVRAAEMERAEWGDPNSWKSLSKTSTLHLALADWLQYTSELLAIAEADGIVEERPFAYALAVARLIVNEKASA